MNPAQLAKQYLADKRMMQIATVAEGKPWICTVYYVHDEAFNLYWLSLPTRRHSQEIAKDQRTAIAIPVKFDLPIIGMQFEGSAEAITDAEIIKTILPAYVEKYDRGHDFLENFIAGKSQHVLYKFTPDAAWLFDEVNFPGGERQKIALAA